MGPYIINRLSRTFAFEKIEDRPDGENLQTYYGIVQLN
jgi:hypothetical protein